MIHRHALITACCLVTLCLLPLRVSAHDGGDDIAWVELSGGQSDGEATMQVAVTELAVCDQVEPLRLVGIRAELEVTGTLDRVEPCRFEGSIALPESGRWMVTAQFSYDSREAEVTMPVGVTDTPQEFQRGDWLHAVGDEESGWTANRILLLALLGLAIGALVTFSYKRVLFVRRSV